MFGTGVLTGVFGLFIFEIITCFILYKKAQKKKGDKK